MTKAKEPSKATIRAWYDAVSKWAHPDPFDDNRNTDSNVDAARIIQRHVDREVRRAVRRHNKVAMCSDRFVKSLFCGSYINTLSAQKNLVAAVNAMKDGKKT